MGKVIVCSGKLADNPYVVPYTEKKLYSIEEICYYVSTNIYGIEPGFFSPKLIAFIREELTLPETADKLQSLVTGNYDLEDLVTALLCGCDLYSREEILELINLIKSLSEMPAWERRAYIGYRKLEEKRYLSALKYFRGTLGEESLSEKDYGIILKAMGICLVNISSFKDAADCFYKAYKYTRDSEALIFALTALKLGNLSKELADMMEELPKDDSIQAEADRIWKEAEKRALNGEKLVKLEKIFDKLRTNKVSEGYKEIEYKLDEFKTEYREGARNELVS